MWKYCFPTDEDFVKRLDTRATASSLHVNEKMNREGLLTKCCQKCCIEKHVDSPASQWVFGTHQSNTLSEAVEVVEHHANFQSVNAAWRGSQKKVSSNRLTANQRKPWEATANLKLTRYQPRQLLTLVKTGSWKIWGLCSVLSEVYSNSFTAWCSSVDEMMRCSWDCLFMNFILAFCVMMW